MSNNTLIAFCVGAMFLLAVIVVAGSFIDRRHSREHPIRYIEDAAPAEEPTAPWPVVPKSDTNA